MKRILSLLLVTILLLSLSGCRAKKTNIPEDFEFSLTWNTYGVSSYNSQTGRLVKTNDATNPDDYITYYRLTDEDKEYIYGLISELDIDSYPERYDPQNGISKPPATLILTVNSNGKQRSIRAAGISSTFKSEDEKGQAFLSVCEKLITRLTSTDEWRALPDYERLYS